VRIKKFLTPIKIFPRTLLLLLGPVWLGLAFINAPPKSKMRTLALLLATQKCALFCKTVWINSRSAHFFSNFLKFKNVPYKIKVQEKAALLATPRIFDSHTIAKMSPSTLCLLKKRRIRNRNIAILLLCLQYLLELIITESIFDKVVQHTGKSGYTGVPESSMKTLVGSGISKFSRQILRLGSTF
jgi:hypothetical protein